MESTITLLDTIFNDWKILAFAFTLGGGYYQARIWFKKLTDSLENTSKVHSAQNVVLDHINEKLENLDKRIARIEDSVESIQEDNREQAIKLAVLESHSDYIEPPAPKRRIKRQV